MQKKFVWCHLHVLERYFISVMCLYEYIETIINVQSWDCSKYILYNIYVYMHIKGIIELIIEKGIIQEKISKSKNVEKYWIKRHKIIYLNYKRSYIQDHFHFFNRMLYLFTCIKIVENKTTHWHVKSTYSYKVTYEDYKSVIISFSVLQVIKQSFLQKNFIVHFFIKNFFESTISSDIPFKVCVCARACVMCVCARARARVRDMYLIWN